MIHIGRYQNGTHGEYVYDRTEGLEKDLNKDLSCWSSLKTWEKTSHDLEKNASDGAVSGARCAAGI